MKPSLSLLNERAVFSSDGQYRYYLRRTHTLGPTRPCVWIMLNPSKAGHRKNDSTTTLTIKFGRLFRTTDHIAVNLFALIDTYPTGLTKVDDPIGPNNDDWIKMVIDFATTHGGLIVVAWGNHGKLLNRSSDVRKMLDGYPNIYCFGLTKQGEPRFPRAISYDQPLVPFRIRGKKDE